MLAGLALAARPRETKHDFMAQTGLGSVVSATGSSDGRAQVIIDKNWIDLHNRVQKGSSLRNNLM